MKKSKRLIFIGVCVFVAAVALAVFARGSFRPAMPVEWHKLQKGMSRQEAVSILHGEVEDLRELKGFDQATRETSLLGSSSVWQLYVSYDITGHVSSASVRFVCRPHGIFNTTSTLVE
jgi:hypothetical protein